MALFATALWLWAAPQAVGQPWQQRAAGPFFYQAEFPLDEHASLWNDLVQIQHELVRCLGIPEPHETVRIVLFRDEARYRSFVRQRLPNVPFRRAMYVKSAGPGAVYAFRGPEMAVDVRHEATHGLLHASLPMVPLWLDEGLAEYFEVDPKERAFGNPHLKIVNWQGRLWAAPRLSRLEAKHDLAAMSVADYRDAWAWVHFMLHGPPEAHQELTRFLGDIGDLNPPGHLSQRLDQRLGDSQSQLVDHFKNWRR